MGVGVWLTDVLKQALNKEADGSFSLYEPVTGEEGPSKFRFHGAESAPPPHTPPPPTAVDATIRLLNSSSMYAA